MVKYNAKTGEVEGSVDEIAQIMGLTKEVKTEAVNKETTTSSVAGLKFGGYGWTPEQDQYLLDALKNNTFNAKKAEKVLGNSNGSIHNRVKLLQAKNNLPTVPIQSRVSVGWTAEQDKIIKEEYSKDLSVPIDYELLQVKMPERSRKQIQDRAHTLGVADKGRSRRGSSTFYKKRPNEFSAFKSQRVKELIKHGANYFDAMKQANNEWTKMHGKQKVFVKPAEEVSIVENFPKFSLLSSGFETVLESLVRNLIANGGKISFPNAGYSLGIEDGSHWRDFVAEFISKTPTISAYFGVQNKFKHEKENDTYDIITYKN